MKAKLLSIFAAAAISLGGTVAATSGASAGITAAPAAAAGANSVSGGVQLAHYRPWYHRHGYRGWRKRRMCRRLFIAGFRYGNPRARYLWRKHCRGYRGYYGYRGYRGPGYGPY